MRYKVLMIVAVLVSASAIAFAQEPPVPLAQSKSGSVKFTAQVEINGKTEKLDRKRFYLIRGSRQQNIELIKKIAESAPLSRDCYFANLRQTGRSVSAEYVCWLKKNDCESPYCREIKTAEEVQTVPEFAAAYNQGLRKYKTPVLALKWLPNNLPAYLRIGFYQQQKSALSEIINLAKTSAQEATRVKKGAAIVAEGFQSVMTDRLGNAYFLDVDVVPPANKKSETYLVSNLMPFVFGETSYLWTCEIEIDPAKPQAPVVLKNEIGKKKCEVVTKNISENCKPIICQAKTSETVTTTNN